VTQPALRWLDSLQGSGIRPGLDRMRAILRVLGRPQHAVPSIIVAGTNGKGSTSATLASILHASGYRTGLYTSPHLVDIHERWMIDGQPISDELLVESIARLRAASRQAGIKPTYFEALTLIAFIAFDLARCEISVLEVGMGGRLDATNVVRPLAALITPIGLDHTEFLGNTMRRIAFEKAGVIHRGAAVLTSNHDPDVLDVLRRRAAKFGEELHVVEPRTRGALPLRGKFQRDNIALAARAAEVLMPSLPRITRKSIERGIAATRWRGRLERFRIGNKKVWVDGCHNAHAARAIAPFIDDNLRRPRLLVFGIMGDKNVAEVAALLMPLFDRVITTEPYPPRSASAKALVEIAKDLGVPAQAIASPRKAFAAALASDERAVFIGGSLYLAGAAIAFLDQKRDQ
jgi:dihydrofolate synthase / folylpolyglutamate synthase